MIKKENVFLCAPVDKQPAEQSFHRIGSSSCESRFKIFYYTAFALFCLMLGAPLASAQSRNRQARSSSARREERPRRADEKKANAKLMRTHANAGSRRENRIAKREIARREVASSRRDNQISSRRDNQFSSRRESVTRTTATLPLVRKTVIIAPAQTSKPTAPRPSLVNDIVIVSLAEEAPIASRLPATTKSNTSIISSSNMPSIWPVAGTFGHSGFGFRRNPFGGSSIEFHKGQDISAPYGAPVIATADGVVVIAGWLRGYGRVVYIDHGNGISTRYGHLSRLDVTLGQTIKRGQQLGLVGSTGRSTGPHLHYEVRVDGQATNPVPYIPNAPAPAIQTAPGIQ